MMSLLRVLAMAIVSRFTVGIDRWRWKAPEVNMTTEDAPKVEDVIAVPPDEICEVCRERSATRAVAWESSAFVPPSIYCCEHCVYRLHRKSDWGVA